MSGKPRLTMTAGLKGTSTMALIIIEGQFRFLALAGAVGREGLATDVVAFTRLDGSCAGPGAPMPASTSVAVRRLGRWPRSSSHCSSFSTGQALITDSAGTQARRAMPTP